MNRVCIHCPHFPACSGCSLSENVNHPPVLEEMRALFKEFPVYAGPSEKWRCRAKLAVRKEGIGLYQKGSHIPIDIPFCRVHHPAINEAAELLRHFGIVPYNEETLQGLLRYVQLAVERATGRVQLTLVLNERVTEWQELWEAHPWHSLWLNFNSRRDNVIFGPEWQLFRGEPFLLDGDVCYHPASFGQANPVLFEKLIHSIKAQMPPDCSVVEYYAGVGGIGLSLVDKCHEVVCCEANSQAEQCFAQSKERLPPKSRISFVNARAETRLDLMEAADVVIVDPPRKGLDLLFLKGVKQQRGPKSLFYISCGWEAFQRDSLALQEAGWNLEHVEGYILFPGTNHVELLARFNRSLQDF